MFSETVTRHWTPGTPGADGVHVVVDPSADENRAVSLIRVVDGPSIVTVSPDKAEALSLSEGDVIAPDRLAADIRAAGITLNDPDAVFYLPTAEQNALRDTPAPAGTRQLTAEDADAFRRFADAAPEADMDEAFVELDHWLVFGTFVDGDLVAAASMYPWGRTWLADLGAITLPDHRGHGHGTATVRAMSARALGLGYEPQYRCQLDNTSSIALAEAAGFARFGEWEVILLDG